jgi:hypothetical protein
MIKKIFYYLMIGGVFGAAIGYYMYTKPLESIESLKTSFSISSDDLLTAFESDEDLANQKYLDKVIEVKGKVSKTERNNGTTSVYLATENELSSVIFQLESDDPSIKEGQEITLKGICTGYLMDVVLVRSVKV